MALDYNDYDEYNDSPAASVTQLLSPDGYGYNVQYISTTLGNGVIQGTSTHYSATATLPPFNANLQYGGVDIYHTMHGFGQIVYSASVVN
ncbi:hypothetical protein CCAX7_22860 [Capsulimonas corticalis]|uniref:Uncharacterized protein n=2 Tax=Capsulimonas corticalis TaxID=2219043 RepID=A0A402CV03_9BACT|nr:hypothetical protein CCAX7_22860 [Capsulimonas corticalis]